VAAYYYLIAQLPYLSYAAGAPMSSDAFRALCAEQMVPTDVRLLDFCAIVPAAAPAEASTGSAFIDSWLAWERALRLHLVKARAAQLKRDAKGAADAPVEPLDAAAAARSALSMDSPLEAEYLLDRARWTVIDTLQGFDFFGRDAAYAYLLKLLILERKSLFRVEEGFAEYKAVYASVMEAAPTSIESGEPK
jgi:hypothetical protein